MLRRGHHVRALCRAFSTSLDLIAVLLLSLTVLLTGGFREWTPWGRDLGRPRGSARWSSRWCCSASAIGCSRGPRSSTRTGVASRRSHGTRRVRGAADRARHARGVLLVGFLAISLFGYRADVPVPWRVYENEFLNLPARWDTGLVHRRRHSTATSGCRARTRHPTEHRVLSALPDAHALRVAAARARLMWTGVLISWLSFFGALVYLYRFARERFGADAARAAAGAARVLSVRALLQHRLHRVALSADDGGRVLSLRAKTNCGRRRAGALLAGLTRPNGCLLSMRAGAHRAARRSWPCRTRRPDCGLRAAGRGSPIAVAVAALPGHRRCSATRPTSTS